MVDSEISSLLLRFEGHHFRLRMFKNFLTSEKTLKPSRRLINFDMPKNPPSLAVMAISGREYRTSLCPYASLYFFARRGKFTTPVTVLALSLVRNQVDIVTDQLEEHIQGRASEAKSDLSKDSPYC